MGEFSLFDRPEVLRFIFYPRRDFSPQPRVPNATAYFIPVAEGISISCRFYFNSEKAPDILFFHGNGEIASDYDDIAPFFTRIGVNFFVADYRGYGLSGGKPTFTDMVKDAHFIFDGFKQMLEQEGYSGRVFVMGRSLGSASAIELACSYQEQLGGLIVESGFADVIRLLAHIGVPVAALGLDQVKVSLNIERMPLISIPTLIIHGEYDSLIPVQEGERLYRGSGAEDKRLLIIPKADHNDILFLGMDDYLSTLREFVVAHS
jgi:alpha-beta hydrolase superfamily lysophospholipase